MAQQQTGQPERRRGSSLVGPLVLIALGVIFLLNTMGVLPWNVWESLWRLWPLVLVLIGLELLLGRGNPWLSGFVALLAIGVAAFFLVLGGVFAYRVNGPFLSRGGPEAVLAVSQLSVPLEGAREGVLNLRFGAGKLDVGTLGGDTGSLLEGSYGSGSDRQQPTLNVSRQGERADVNIQSSEGGGITLIPGTGAENLNLLLNSAVLWDLRVQGGAADGDLDLRQLRVRDLLVELGASSIEVRLPEAAGQTTARFKTGMASVRIEVPSKVAARIASRGGLSSFKVDERRFPKQGNYYMSPGWETAQNRVDIDIDAGMASVTVQ
ncbi:MAG: LiaI-LiaF-like domain-containing protein [Chloroflexota bacterium]